MSTLAVVEGILREAAVPMSVREIVERAGASLPTKSKTPDTVVARDLSMDIKKKGEASIFVRTAPGRYTMRDIHLARLEGERLAIDAQDGNGAVERAAEAVREERPTEIVATTIGEHPSPKGTKAVGTPAKSAQRPNKTVVQPQQ